MKKDWKIVSQYAQAEFLDFVPTNYPEDKKVEFDDSPLKQILDEIFCVDENTGFPRGDIQYYMSSNGNPQVKQWIENNLLKPRMSSRENLEGLTDDMIAEFAQRKDESLDDYTERLQGLYDVALEEYNKSLITSPNE